MGEFPHLSYLPDRRYVLPVIRDILHGCELFLDRVREAGVLQYVSEPLVSGQNALRENSGFIQRW